MRVPELVVTFEELQLLLSDGDASCERCQDDFKYVLDIYRIQWEPGKFDVVILCTDCAGIVHRFLARLRGEVP